MADNRLDEAIDIVARQLIAQTLRAFAEAAWDLDDLSETSWEDVNQRAEELVPYPEWAQYKAAYQYLTDRAEGGAS